MFFFNSNQQPRNNGTPRDTANDFNSHLNVFSLNRNLQPVNNATPQDTSIQQTIRSIQVPLGGSHIVYSNDVVTDRLAPEKCVQVYLTRMPRVK